MLNEKDYWKEDNDGVRLYYLDYKLIGDEHSAVKYMISNRGISSSNAHKAVRKMKKLTELKPQKRKGQK